MWATNIRPNFMDVQEADRRVSQQCRVGNHMARRRSKKGRNFVPDSIASATSCERPSQSHSDGHMSCDMIDQVLSNIPDS